MKNSYSITANSCCFPSVELKIISVNWHQMHQYLAVIKRAFREIEILNDDTGEVMFRHYESDEMFSPLLSIGECISAIEDLKKEFDNR